MGCGADRSGTARDRPNLSDHEQQRQIIRLLRTHWQETRKHRSEGGRGGRQQSSYRATRGTWGAGATSEMGAALDHRPGHTITLRRRRALGVGIGRVRLGAALAGSQDIASADALPGCLLLGTANHQAYSRSIRMCERCSLRAVAKSTTSILPDDLPQ